MQSLNAVYPSGLENKPFIALSLPFGTDHPTRTFNCLYSRRADAFVNLTKSSGTLPFLNVF